ncbi:type II secretion system F family protein [Cohnella pontilimi]|nr:type II secretion system F family protein [Cohnella pontilimi]
MGCGILCFFLLSVYACFGLRSFRRKGGKRSRAGFAWHDPIAELLRWRGVYDRLLPLLHRPRIALVILEGGECPPERLMRWTAEGVAMAYGGLFLCWMLAFVSGNLTAALFGTVIASCIPFLRAKELQRELTQRKEAILLELPILLSRLLVMVNAGENVRRALHRIVEAQLPRGRCILYEELRAALAAMQRGESMHLAMEQFGRRCAVPEVKLFATLLLMNAKRGGEEFVPVLRDLTRQMWEKRKSAARTLGEQASSRLAFPLAIVFLIIVSLVAAPTVMMMS